MKNKKLRTVGFSFVLGAFVGISVLALSGFTNGNANKQAGQSPINATQANQLFKNYYENATPLNDKLKGVTIDMAQYNSMKTIMESGSNPTAFRIYFGKSDNGDPYGITVGVNAEGGDMTNNDILRSSQGTLGPCPHICDAASPITAQ